MQNNMSLGRLSSLGENEIEAEGKEGNKGKGKEKIASKTE